MHNMQALRRVLLWGGLLLLAGGSLATDQQSAPQLEQLIWHGKRIQVVKGDVVVRLRAGTGEAELQALVGRHHLKLLRRLSLGQTSLFSVSAGDGLADRVEKIQREPKVKWAEPVFINVPHVFPSPNDPFYQGTSLPQEFWLGQTGQDEAWNDAKVIGSKGSANVVVAILGSGIDYLHQDFFETPTSSRILTDAAGPGPLIPGVGHCRDHEIISGLSAPPVPSPRVVFISPNLSSV